jgi:hypothetical protein
MAAMRPLRITGAYERQHSRLAVGSAPRFVEARDTTVGERVSQIDHDPNGARLNQTVTARVTQEGW